MGLWDRTTNLLGSGTGSARQVGGPLRLLIPYHKGTRLFILWGHLIAGCQYIEKGHWEDGSRLFIDLHGRRTSNNDLALTSHVCSHDYSLLSSRSFEFLGNLASRSVISILKNCNLLPPSPMKQLPQVITLWQPFWRSHCTAFFQTPYSPVLWRNGWPHSFPSLSCYRRTQKEHIKKVKWDKHLKKRGKIEMDTLMTLMVCHIWAKVYANFFSLETEFIWNQLLVSWILFHFFLCSVLF